MYQKTEPGIDAAPMTYRSKLLWLELPLSSDSWKLVALIICPRARRIVYTLTPESARLRLNVKRERTGQPHMSC